MINPKDAPWEKFQESEIYIDSNFVSKNLDSKYGLRNHKIILYNQLASRAINRAAVVSQAIAQKPDLIVMTFNPLNSYNSNRIFVPKRYMNMAPPYWIASAAASASDSAPSAPC